MDKQNKAFKVLEFDKILERLSSYTESKDVKKRIEEIVPYTELEDARAAQKETTEAMSTLLKLGSPPVNLSVENVLGAVKRTERDGVLHTKELMNISRLFVCRKTYEVVYRRISRRMYNSSRYRGGYHNGKAT